MPGGRRQAFLQRRDVPEAGEEKKKRKEKKGKRHERTVFSVAVYKDSRGFLRLTERKRGRKKGKKGSTRGRVPASLCSGSKLNTKQQKKKKKRRLESCLACFTGGTRNRGGRPKGGKGKKKRRMVQSRVLPSGVRSLTWALGKKKRKKREIVAGVLPQQFPVPRKKKGGKKKKKRGGERLCFFPRSCLYQTAV